VLSRVAKVVIGVGSGALVLLTFDSVRSVGVSLLVSASVAGAVLGLAARPPAGEILSGRDRRLIRTIVICRGTTT
jgi:hypothetical protein